MRREVLSDLTIFLAVAEERSFTRAAAKLGTSQAAVSLAVRRLEERLGVRLLARTTRSVATTEAGARLQSAAAPALGQIEQEMLTLSGTGSKPAGTVRLTATYNAVQTVLLPRLEPFLRDHPAVTVEIVADVGLTDIVAERFDAGVRVGELLSQDMVALRIGPDMRMAVVGAPTYFHGRGKPRAPGDLAGHACIALRLPTHGGLYIWDFEKNGREVNVRVEGQLILNHSDLMAQAAIDGLGLAYLPESQVAEAIAGGRLLRVLADWCPPFPGYHLYYPSRRQHTSAFALLLDALRYKERTSRGTAANGG